jgi:hypothetical protein
MEAYGVYCILRDLKEKYMLTPTKLVHDNDKQVRKLVQEVFIDVQEQLCAGQFETKHLLNIFSSWLQEFCSIIKNNGKVEKTFRLEIQGSCYNSCVKVLYMRLKLILQILFHSLQWRFAASSSVDECGY